MKELERILREHAIRYPAMEPMDAVKLLHQNEFGGGYLLLNEEVCLNYLRQEYAKEKWHKVETVWEDIGNGMVRVNLGALTPDELESLGQVFLCSAREKRGDMASFREKLEVLRELTREGVFAFSQEALDAYLVKYTRQGCPPATHSEAYRRAYRPAYRVIRKDCK